MKRDEKVRDNNRGNKIILFVLVAGYLFFLTSRLWMPDFRELVGATPLYEVQTLMDHEVYLTKWEYSPKEAVMEIVLEVKTKTLIDQEMSWEIIERTEGTLNAEIVLQESDHMVFRITDIPENWKEISLRLMEDGNENILKLYTNVSEVKQVDSLPIKKKTGYEIDRLKGQIEYDEYRIDLKEASIKELTEENKQLEARREELENRVYPTQKEADEAGEMAVSASNKILANEKDIRESEKEIAELIERTESVQAQIEELKKE